MRESSLFAKVVVHISGIVSDEVASLIIVAISALSSNIDGLVSVKSCEEHRLKIEEGRDGGGLVSPNSWDEGLRGCMGDNLSSVLSSFAVGMSLVVIAYHVELDEWGSLDSKVDLGHAIQKVLHVVEVKSGTIAASSATHVDDPNDWDGNESFNHAWHCSSGDNNHVDWESDEKANETDDVPDGQANVPTFGTDLIILLYLDSFLVDDDFLLLARAGVADNAAPRGLTLLESSSDDLGGMLGIVEFSVSLVVWIIIVTSTVIV